LNTIKGVEGTTSKNTWATGTKNFTNPHEQWKHTHDFLDYDFAKRFGWKDNETELSTIEVAWGRSLKVHGMWKHFK